MTGPGFLEVRDVTAGYGETTVLRDVTIEVREGTIAALLGPNGAGKTTLLRIAAGLMRPSAGAILVGGEDCTSRTPHARAREGLCLIPEGRGVFPRLTVRENLLLQLPTGQGKAGIERGIDAFPVLGERLGQRAGTLSGGEQQMLALARCFVAQPKLVLLDEVSMGLAPKVVEEIFESLAKLAAQRISLLLVEQYVTKALEISDAVHLLNRGTITFSGSPSDLDEDAVMRGYLGIEDVPVDEKEE